MKNRKIYAALTGDLIGFTKFEEKQRFEILSLLKDSFKKIPRRIIASPFVIYRGDSFQGVISMPQEAMRAAIIIRAGLLSKFKLKTARLDARIAIGLGTIDYLPPGNRAGEGDGEAFRNSGIELDRMKKAERNLTVKTPWQEIDDELRTECALLDTLMQRWTKEQAEAILYYIQGSTQEEIAKTLKISQPAVFQRLRIAGYRAVQAALERYGTLIEYKVRT
ncbi:SatD family protein [Candidatus Methanoperedens nitratireducens]|uniref:Uncharacterized protein n=1 Tax=Candidatus Methanoperedens nitratireducens TaxID=1392998 RepID=A0A284VSZ7_9EURY|nr:SatD family protein [Candidatus Methanoperedens nitroreducens]SNQ62411.1 conserved hypothetical protein [Candidatus Methanoperedens nitroreducens]